MDLSLKNKEWKEFRFDEIFNIYTGANVQKKYLKKGIYPRISATEQNNGVVEFTSFSNHKNYRKLSNFISISFLGAIFYHSNTASLDMKIHAVHIKNKELNKYLGQFIVKLIKRAVGNVTYGNQLSSKDLPHKKILLPINSQGEPDYEFMEAYIRQKEQEKINAFKNYITKRINELGEIKNVVPLTEKSWGEFFIEDVAEIYSGRDIYNAERKKGNVPYITSTALNNGIGYFVGNNNETLEKGCLSVNRNGSVGYSFYHDYYALYSNDCRKLKLKYQSKYVGIFISQQITKENGKYGYGYKMGTARIKRQKIMLPINQNQEPDYEYMENYIKQIELKKLQKYLEYKLDNELIK